MIYFAIYLSPFWSGPLIGLFSKQLMLSQWQWEKAKDNTVPFTDQKQDFLKNCILSCYPFLLCSVVVEMFALLLKEKRKRR
jgi:hypothetical protein